MPVATRFYFTTRALSSGQQAPYRGPFDPSGGPTGAPQPYQEQLTTYLLGDSKTDGGKVAFGTVSEANGINGFTPFLARWMSEPLVAQTISGTVSAVVGTWGNTTPAALQSIQLFLWVTIGETGQLRGILGSYTGAQLAWPITTTFRTQGGAMTPVDAQAGDRIVAELGVRYSPNPVADDTSSRLYFGTTATNGGAAVADGVDGATDVAVKAGHLTFSASVETVSPIWGGVNDACGSATEVSGDFIQVGPIDTTPSPGVDPVNTQLRRVAWFKWTPTVAGRAIITTIGSNYNVNIRLRTSCGGGTFVNHTGGTDNGASQSLAMFDAILGTTYFIQLSSFSNTTGGSQSQEFAEGSGGELFFTLSLRGAPITDDLYVAGTQIVVYRTTLPGNPLINSNGRLTAGVIPTGMAFDYSRRAIGDQNGGTHAADRLVTGLFFFTLLEFFDAATLNEGENEINFIDMTTAQGASLPDANTVGGNQRIVPLGRDVGEAIVGFEGDNYDFIGALSSQDNASLRRIDLTQMAGTAPFEGLAIEKYPAELEVQATDHHDVADDEDTIFYTSAGRRIMRYRMSTQTQLADFVANVPNDGGPRPGLRGLRLLPDGGLVVADGLNVKHYNSAGGLVKTIWPSNLARHQSLERMVLDSTGSQVWVVDIVSSDLLLFDITSGQQTDLIVTGLPAGNVCGIACYRGFEPIPPPPDPGDVVPPPVIPPPSEGPGVVLPIRRQRAAPHINEEKTWKFYSRLQLDLETGVGLDGLATLLGHDPTIMLDWSDDGGHTWSNEHWASAGKIGKQGTRALWRRLGRARDRVFRITVSDPVKWRFVDAYLRGQGGTS